MWLAFGGKIKQKLYPDPYGVEVWDLGNVTSLSVHIVNSEAYGELFGEEPPPSPISAQTYADWGLPWGCARHDGC